ncbi:hypothetical protein CgunFtcFv8_006236 [Champsocephalus gunnari]|uniref:Uncharacterized protein n=1 Tax=Champsocephalus gunnari TaxID=52237 RepID=A0AAN8GV47_CHAGU|nr:hypothetical protein CgunFtcFv8_006236 [Champsocephalus gunnari]
MLLSFYETGSHFNGLKKTTSAREAMWRRAGLESALPLSLPGAFLGLEKEQGESSFPQGRETFTRRQSSVTRYT